MASSTSTPTTGWPRRLSSMATRPVPQPASRTDPGRRSRPAPPRRARPCRRRPGPRSGGRSPRRAGRRSPATGRSRVVYGMEPPPGTVLRGRAGGQGEEARGRLGRVLRHLEVVGLRGARVRRAGPAWSRSTCRLVWTVTLRQVEGCPAKVADEVEMTLIPSARPRTLFCASVRRPISTAGLKRSSSPPSADWSPSASRSSRWPWPSSSSCWRPSCPSCRSSRLPELPELPRVARVAGVAGVARSSRSSSRCRSRPRCPDREERLRRRLRDGDRRLLTVVDRRVLRVVGQVLALG